MAKNENSVTEQEVRKDAILCLREFAVHGEDGTVDYVFAHRTGLGHSDAALFYTDTMDGTFCRAVYRNYKKVIEIVKIDNNQSKSINN